MRQGYLVATIKQRGDVWQVTIRRAGFKPIYATFDTERQAIDYGQATEQDMRRGRYIDHSEADSTTLAEALDRYEIEVSAQKKGWKQEKSRIKFWREFRFGDKSALLSSRPLSGIKGKDVAMVRDKLTLGGSSGSTVRLALALLSHVYTIARLEWGIPIENPCDAVRKPKPGKSRDRRVSADELERVLGHARKASPNGAAAIMFAVETGMRMGEIAGMRWDYLRGNVAVLPDTKNGESRDVPLSTAALAAIRSVPRQINGKIFGMMPKSIGQVWSRSCTLAGIDDLHFHDLRHEAATRLSEQGFTVPQMQQVTGHESWSSLQRYVSVTPRKSILEFDEAMMAAMLARQDGL